MPEGLLRLLEYLIPSVDDWIVNSYLSGEDEQGEFTVWGAGTDKCFSKDGLTELTGLELEEAQLETCIWLQECYLRLLPLKELGLIKDLWLNNGCLNFPNRATVLAELANLRKEQEEKLYMAGGQHA